MAFKAGTAAHVLIDGVSGTPVNMSQYMDNFSWPQSVANLDVSAFGTAAKAFIVGLTDGDVIAVSGPLDVTLGTFITALKAAQSAGSTTITVTYSPGGSVAGQLKVSAETNFAQFTPSTGVGGRAEFSASLQVTGAVVNTTW